MRPPLRRLPSLLVRGLRRHLPPRPNLIPRRRPQCPSSALPGASFSAAAAVPSPPSSASSSSPAATLPSPSATVSRPCLPSIPAASRILSFLVLNHKTRDTQGYAYPHASWRIPLSCARRAGASRRFRVWWVTALLLAAPPRALKMTTTTTILIPRIGMATMMLLVGERPTLIVLMMRGFDDPDEDVKLRAFAALLSRLSGGGLRREGGELLRQTKKRGSCWNARLMKKSPCTFAIKKNLHF